MSFPVRLEPSSDLLPHFPEGSLNTSSANYDPNTLEYDDINTEGYAKYQFRTGYLQGGKLKKAVTVTFNNNHYMLFPVGSKVVMHWHENNTPKNILLLLEQTDGPVVIHPPIHVGGKRRRTHRRRAHRHRTHRHRRRTHRRHHY